MVSAAKRKFGTLIDNDFDMHPRGSGNDASLDFHLGADHFCRWRFGHPVREDTYLRRWTVDTAAGWILHKEVSEACGADNAEIFEAFHDNYDVVYYITGSCNALVCFGVIYLASTYIHIVKAGDTLKYKKLEHIRWIISVKYIS